ncbi:CD2 antigen cytoplasmic tail-binding protein 2 homolog holn1 [Brevipalpus obovatus]|uniref:CD2 antigen cytoplasmic tail-binding protein 2 homolog holn1 n=1 Tax=Brevipalpus obovatus TaxID=246614 RepID=UPI003D9F0F8C
MFKGSENEEAGIPRVEDNITFTPFNLREERTEGHFDEAGNFIFKKESGLVQDSWVQDVDKCQLADPSKFHKPQEDNDDSFDLSTSTYKILVHMYKNETIKAAIRRIGARINELRKENRKAKSDKISNEIKEETKKLDELTSFADQALFNEDAEIYDKTYTQLEKIASKPVASTSNNSRGGNSRADVQQEDDDSNDEEEEGRGKKRKNDFETSSSSSEEGSSEEEDAV